jgi:hypothetical protein
MTGVMWIGPDEPDSPWRVGEALRDEFDAGWRARAAYVPAEGEARRLLRWGIHLDGPDVLYCVQIEKRPRAVQPAEGMTPGGFPDAQQA